MTPPRRFINRGSACPAVAREIASSATNAGLSSFMWAARRLVPASNTRGQWHPTFAYDDRMRLTDCAWKDSSTRRWYARDCDIALNVSVAPGTVCLSSIKPKRIWLTSCPLHAARLVSSSSRAAATSSGDKYFCRASETIALAKCLAGRLPFARMGPAHGHHNACPTEPCSPLYRKWVLAGQVQM